jgi:hypothetical protein
MKIVETTGDDFPYIDSGLGVIIFRIVPDRGFGRLDQNHNNSPRLKKDNTENLRN